MFFLFGIYPFSGDLGRGVIELFDDLFFDSRSVRRDDREKVSSLFVLDYLIANDARKERIEDAENDGLIVEIENSRHVIGRVNEERSKGYDDIDADIHEKEVEKGVLLADVHCGDIGAAGRSVQLEAARIHEAHDDARDYAREYRINAARIVLYHRKIEALKKQIKERIAYAENERIDAEVLVDFEDSEDTKRNVDDKREITYRETELILYHRRDTVHPRGSEFVVDDKQNINDGLDKAEYDYLGIN